MPHPKLAALALTAALFAGGCSDDSSPSDSSKAESALIAALGKVRATDSTRRYVEYGDVAKAWSLYNTETGRFYTVAGYGMRTLAAASGLVSEKLGLDPLSMREAVSAGIPPDWSAIAWGDYDVDAVNRRLAGFGLESTEVGVSTTWTAPTDADFRAGWPFAESMQPDMLDNVRTAPGSFAYSPKRDGLAWVTDPGEDTLAKDPTTRALAACLGDVVSAAITREAASEAVAIGVRVPSPADVTEVVCVAPGTEAIQDHATDQLASGQRPGTDHRWSDLLPDTTVELIGGPHPVVRVTSAPKGDAAPNHFEVILRNGELDELLGLRPKP